MISWPWDSIIEGFDEESGFPIYDRAYRAEQLREIMMRVFSNGVFAETPEAFVVTKGDGLSVKVSAGTCHIQGAIGVEKSTTTLMLSSDPTKNRRDTIVLRWDASLEARSIVLDVKKGTPANTNMQRPALERSDTVWELGIADIFIPAGASNVTTAMISDTRLDTSRCGIVTPFTTIDTTSFLIQIQEAIDSGLSDIDGIIEDFEARLDRSAKELEDEVDEIERKARELDAAAERAKELADALINETFVGQVMEILETLAKKHVLYLSIDDDATDSIDDDNGDKILGDVKFDIGGSSGECECEAATATEIDALFDKIRKVQNG